MKNDNTKELISSAVESLIEELKQGKTSRLENYLKFCSNFHNYSINNTLLIYFQMPEASKVAGFKTWSKLGYKIKKGEKAIKILAPQTYKYILRNGEIIYFNRMTEEEKAQTYNHKLGITFKPVPVFDINQCEKLTNEDHEFFIPLGNTHKDQYENLKLVIESQGIKVIETNTGSAEGVSHGGLIEIKETIDYNNKLLTLIHENAHEILDKGAESDRDKTDRNIRECRAEAVSYIVGNYLGLHNPFSRDYLLIWGNTEEEIRVHLEAILKASNRIIESIESFNKKDKNIA